jgi:hypothetical protein
MRKSLIAAILAFVGLQGTANAGDFYFYSGNTLAKLLAEYQKAERKDRDTNYADAWKFRAYVIGVHDTASGILFCPPADLGEVQTSAIVAKYMENNPQEWNKSGSTIVTMALSQAFPCSKKP